MERANVTVTSCIVKQLTSLFSNHAIYFVSNVSFSHVNADYLDLTEFASKILHPLVRALDKNDPVTI